MTSRAQTTFAYVVVTALLTLAAWGFVEAVQADPALVGAIGVAGVSAGAIVWQQRQAEMARVREAHRDRMGPIYDKLLGVMAKLFTSEGRPLGPEDQTFFRDLKAKELMLGASSEMIRAYNAWQRDTMKANDEGNNGAAILAYEDLIRAIRRDLGHDDTGLPPRELLEVFMTDLDKVLSEKN